MKKRLLLIGSAVVVLCGVLISVFVSKTALAWTPLHWVNNCEGLDAPIEKIELRKGNYGWQWTVFEDEDLIAVWTEYFDHIEVKREGATDYNPAEWTGGAMPTAIITTKRGTYSIMFCAVMEGGYESVRDTVGVEGDCELIIDGYAYSVKSDIDCPYNATYDESMTRHGAVTQ